MDATRKNIHRNTKAGDLIRALRIDQGLSPEDLSYAIFRAELGSVSGRTIRRIESDGMIPRVRAQFAIAQYFGRSVTSIWQPSPIRRSVRRAVAA